MEKDYTMDSYLGSDFQLKLLWQILTEPEFAEQILPFIKTDYWDDVSYKRYYIIIDEYFKEYGRPPNLQNKSIYNAIARYKHPNDPTEEEILLSITENIKNWNENVLNNGYSHDGDAIQKQAISFIKQGEYADLADIILTRVKSGKVSDETLYLIEEKVKKIAEIGNEEDDGTEIFEDIEKVLEKNFRNPIPTGIEELDRLMGGGLGRGEMGIVLAPSGVGKSTILTKFANEAFKHEKNVLQIIFEDTPDQIKRKHYAIWSGIKLSEMDNRANEVAIKVHDAASIYNKTGKLVIKRLPQDGTTIPKIRQWIDRYKKKHGIKFDIIILDYLDCVDPHKKSVDQNQAELAIVKAFETMAGEYDIPCWTALQTNRSGFNMEKVGHAQMGGNIKRAQKTHFLMSIAKTEQQKEAGMANASILKARFAQDGQFFEDIIFSNDEVRVDFSRGNRKRKDNGETNVDEFNGNMTSISMIPTDEEIEKELEQEFQETSIEVENTLIDPTEELNKLKSNSDINPAMKNHVGDLLKQMADNQHVVKKKEY